MGRDANAQRLTRRQPRTCRAAIMVDTFSLVLMHALLVVHLQRPKQFVIACMAAS